MDSNFPDIEITAESAEFNKCDLCTNSKCCTYVTQQIDVPRSKYDFEVLLWQVSHDNVGAYKDDDGCPDEDNDGDGIANGQISTFGNIFVNDNFFAAIAHQVLPNRCRRLAGFAGLHPQQRYF